MTSFFQCLQEAEQTKKDKGEAREINRKERERRREDRNSVRRMGRTASSAQIQYCANCEGICDTICEECEVSIHNECSLAEDAGCVH